MIVQCSFEMNNLKLILKNTLLASIFLLTACGAPKSEQVMTDFKNEHPEYTVLSTVVGEGDGGNASFHIKFKKPNDEKIYVEIWLYQDIGWSNTVRIRDNGKKETIVGTKWK